MTYRANYVYRLSFSLLFNKQKKKGGREVNRDFY